MKRQRTSTLLIAAAAGLLQAISAPMVMAANTCEIDQLQPLMAEGGSSISGRGVLLVNREGAEAIIRANNLIPGAAYTAWFIYFDNTSKCMVPGQCGPGDALMPASNPVGVFGRMDSAIAGTGGRLSSGARFAISMCQPDRQSTSSYSHTGRRTLRTTVLARASCSRQKLQCWEHQGWVL